MSWVSRIIGRRSTISTSNTRKITANRKNRREKGCRADLCGSKPHSKGEDFSRSVNERVLRTEARAKMVGGRIRLMIAGISIKFMSSEFKINHLRVKSSTLFSFQKRDSGDIHHVINHIKIAHSSGALS